MKYCLLILILAACSNGTNGITGGNIIGKYTEYHVMCKGDGHAIDKQCFYLTCIQDGYSGNVEVTEQAWNQAIIGMKWPFEVK